MSERPPSSHISCHSRQANQSRVWTRVSEYFPSYSTGLQTLKPRVRVDRPIWTLHYSAHKNPTKPPAINSRPPASHPPPLPKQNPSTPPPQTHTSRSGVLARTTAPVSRCEAPSVGTSNPASPNRPPLSSPSGERPSVWTSILQPSSPPVVRPPAGARSGTSRAPGSRRVPSSVRLH
ncbi:uncharacterized protein M6B38_390855 [Iris pallida]|uniref:Uncharacterized protein n=1 Tax=Iris pallida TaxID=29817 RepID=A0AAX6G0J9_IRIPA|nr:uncharacterized protein M6B38_390855 [Iris pallida]